MESKNKTKTQIQKTIVTQKEKDKSCNKCIIDPKLNKKIVKKEEDIIVDGGVF